MEGKVRRKWIGNISQCSEYYSAFCCLLLLHQICWGNGWSKQGNTSYFDQTCLNSRTEKLFVDLFLKFQPTCGFLFWIEYWFDHFHFNFLVAVRNKGFGGERSVPLNEKLFVTDIRMHQIFILMYEYETNM